MRVTGRAVSRSRSVAASRRTCAQRTVRHDPFSTQTDALKQLREQVARLAIRVEAERRVLDRRMIGKLPRRPGQTDWRRWTIGKVFRWSWAASAAAAEAGALVAATLKHATGGVVIAFAEVLEDA
jgi:hypothetical protein